MVVTTKGEVGMVVTTKGEVGMIETTKEEMVVTTKGEMVETSKEEMVVTTKGEMVVTTKGATKTTAWGTVSLTTTTGQEKIRTIVKGMMTKTTAEKIQTRMMIRTAVMKMVTRIKRKGSRARPEIAEPSPFFLVGAGRWKSLLRSGSWIKFFGHYSLKSYINNNYNKFNIK